MPSKEVLEADLRTAMKAGDDVRKRTLRMVLSAVKLAEVEKRGHVDEATLIAILQKEIKTRRESITDAERAHRDDIIAASQAEIDVLNSFLPQRLSQADLQTLVQKAIEETGASGPQDMGKVMKAVMPHVQGRADGKDVNELVRSLLAQA
ncbi:MAG: GatB/YqeY domain-containing protein [Anaerolineales bacterium]